MLTTDQIAAGFVLLVMAAVFLLLFLVCGIVCKLLFGRK